MPRPKLAMRRSWAHTIGNASTANPGTADSRADRHAVLHEAGVRPVLLLGHPHAQCHLQMTDRHSQSGRITVMTQTTKAPRSKQGDGHDALQVAHIASRHWMSRWWVPLCAGLAFGLASNAGADPIANQIYSDCTFTD